MRYRQMISLQVIVNINLPIAVDDIIPPACEMQFIQVATDACGFLWDGSQYLFQCWRRLVLIDEYERAPGLDAKFRQTYFRAIPIFNPVEFRLSKQAAVQRVGPSVIRALKHGSL